MKKLPPALIFLSGLAALFGVSGCDSTPDRHPKETQKVVLSAAHAAPGMLPKYGRPTPCGATNHWAG